MIFNPLYLRRYFSRGTAVLPLIVVLLMAAGPAVPYDRNFVESLEGYYARPVSCGEHIIYYADRGEKLAVEIEKIACRSIGDIADGIGLEKVTPVAFIIARDTRAFRLLHGGRLPEWGEAFGDSRRMVIGIDASRVFLSNRPFETVVRHELSHLLLAQRTARARCPSWFVEGIAMRQSREWTLGDQWRLAMNVARDDVPRLEDLQGRFPKNAGKAAVAYRISYAAVEELIGSEERTLVTFTAFLRDTRDFEKAFILTFGETTTEFSGRFEASMRNRYRRISLALNISPYGLMLSALFLLAYFFKRSRSRRKVEEWESEDPAPPMAHDEDSTPPTVH